MTVEVYSVDKDLVLTYLPQWQVSGSDLPQYDSIDTSGEFLTRAGVDFAVACAKGGYGMTPTITSDGTPYAYSIARSLIAERAAQYYIKASSHGTDTDELARGWARVNRELEAISNGGPLGELSPSASGAPGRADYSHGTETRAQLNARRFKASDPL